MRSSFSRLTAADCLRGGEPWYMASSGVSSDRSLVYGRELYSGRVLLRARGVGRGAVVIVVDLGAGLGTIMCGGDACVGGNDGSCSQPWAENFLARLNGSLNIPQPLGHSLSGSSTLNGFSFDSRVAVKSVKVDTINQSSSIHFRFVKDLMLFEFTPPFLSLNIPFHICPTHLKATKQVSL